MSILEVHDVSIRYMTGDFKEIGLKEYVIRKLKGDYHVNEFWADKNISFALEKGDMLGIIGTNGAGKSTLLKAISGIMEPTGGYVKREGNIAALLELASGFDGDLTVRENAYLRGAMLGYTRQFMDEKYDEIIDFAELQNFQDRPFKQLSSGMKSRLAFSIASLVQPDILILDEVLSVGDGAFRKKSEEKMREIIADGATTILVSHSIQQVRDMCTKVLWLHEGEQVQFGADVQRICDRYEEFLEKGKSIDGNVQRKAGMKIQEALAEKINTDIPNQERIEWVDLARGLCIFFVILMHLKKPRIYSQICAPFFLTTFFFCSGFCFDGRKSAWPSVKRLLQKFVLYGVPFVLITAVLESNPPTVDDYIAMFLQLSGHPRYAYALLWFIPCMIVAKILFSSVYTACDKICGGRKVTFTFAIGCMICCAIGLLLIKYAKFRLPWHIEVALFMQWFMLLGFLAKKCEGVLSHYERQLLAILTLAYISTIILMPIDADLNTLMFTSLKIYCLQATLGTCFFVLLARKISPHGKLFQHIGRNSLFFYAFEHPARTVVNRWIAPSFPLDPFALSLISAVFCLILLACFNEMLSCGSKLVQKCRD